jgi:hypothetical protein
MVVLGFQRTYLAWANENDPERKAAWRDELRLYNDALWELLAGPLHDVARGWINSDVGQEVRATSAGPHCQQDALESLSMHLYWPILDALPKLKIDREKNLLGCLMTIARRGISNENRRVYVKGPGYAHRLEGEPIPESGEPTAAMWPVNGNDYHSDYFEGAEGQVDPTTWDLEDRLVMIIDRQRCWREVQVFWQRNLVVDDRRIITLRWRTDPPIEFNIVAQRMGPGWTAAAVRQRHARIMRRTREYLQELGLIDYEGTLEGLHTSLKSKSIATESRVKPTDTAKARSWHCHNRRDRKRDE